MKAGSELGAPEPGVDGLVGEVAVQGGRIVGADDSIDINGGCGGWRRGFTVDNGNSEGVFVGLREMVCGRDAECAGTDDEDCGFGVCHCD